MLSSPQKALALVSVLGAGLLMVGLMLRDSEIRVLPGVLPGVRLGTLADALGVAAVVLSIAAQMDRLLKISERTEAELRKVRKASSDTYMARLNRTVIQLREGNRPVQVASSRMLEQLATTILPNLADDLLRMNEKGSYSPIPIYNLQTINMILEELAKQLPKGSVWLGLSKLPHPDAWSTAFSNWNELLMDRCERGEVHVCRVWPLHLDIQLRNLEKVLQLQKKRRVTVRYNLDTCNLNEQFPDVSLIWVPPRKNGKPLNLELLASDPLNALRESDYRRLHGLEFETKSSLLLNTFKILPRDTLTPEYEQKFAELWSKSCDVTECFNALSSKLTSSPVEN